MSSAVFLAGCHAPPKAEGPTELKVRIPDRDAFIDRALTALRERDFQPRIADRREGLIVAGPTTSAQWFEFWRVDAPGAYQSLEASLSTIRRTVTVRLISPEQAATSGPTSGVAGSAPAGEECMLRVQVDKERYSAPEIQATTTVGALGLYSEHLPTTEGLRNARKAGEHWVSLGRDVMLEAYFMDLLAALPGVSESSASP